MAVSASLIQWCSGELTRLLDSETTDEFTRYLLGIGEDNDLKEYLTQLLDISDPQNSAFIEELIRKRNSGPSLPQNMTVYRKSDTLEEDSRKGKGKSRSREKKVPPTQEASSAPSQRTSQPQTPLQPTQQSVPNGVPDADEQTLALQQGARRKTKYVALYSQEGEARSAIHLPGRHPCECQAHKHALVSNCLECGRIVCSQEGSGPCLYCGALVASREEQEILARNSKKSEKLRKKLMGEGGRAINGDAVSKPDSIDRAIAHKDKLIEYDKTSVRRTQVVDDQSDYFSSDTNRWLSDKERGELRSREDQLRQQRHGSRLDKKFTLDFAGRKVVEQEAGEMYDRNDEVVQRVTFNNRPSAGSTGKSTSAGPRGPDTTILHPSISAKAPQFIPDASSGTQHPTSSQSALSKDPSSSLSSSTSLTRAKSRVQDKELMEMSDEGQCLSMHQPWASLLVAGIKRHEGRTWYSPHRGRLWIAAAGKAADEAEIRDAESAYIHLYQNVKFPEHFPTGCLLGCVDMVDCLAQEEYRTKFPDGESSSPFVFICEHPQELLLKFPVKGRHKIWRLDGAMHKAAKQGLRQLQQTS